MKNSKNSVSHGNTYPVYQATILFRANAIGTTAETNLTGGHENKWRSRTVSRK